MRTSALLFVGLTFSLSVHAEEKHRFSGAVWENGATRAFFKTGVAPGDAALLSLPKGRSVVVAVDTSGRSTLVLLGPDGKPLHSAVRPAGENGEKSFMYAFCPRGEVVYTSPLDQNRSGCPTGGV